MSFCVCYDSPSNDLWIAERQWGMTDQQVIGGFGDIVFEGTEAECTAEYDKWRKDITYAVYHHTAKTKDDKDRFYIIEIPGGGGSYQENALEYGDTWSRSFTTKEEAEAYIAE